ncbi:hypothetical protein [Methylotuvimicrobium sp. KM1]|uniref:hypothetical protein n=1 Tax=Methylotuvimicrobium sp. KM1 TaxID=3377707 RepID=UPI00384C4BEC
MENPSRKLFSPSQALAWEAKTGSSGFPRPTRLIEFGFAVIAASEGTLASFGIAKLELHVPVSQAGAWETADFPLFPKLLLGKHTPEAPASRDRPNLRTTSLNPGSLVQSFLIVGKLELPEQVTQAGALGNSKLKRWVSASLLPILQLGIVSTVDGAVTKF